MDQQDQNQPSAEPPPFVSAAEKHGFFERLKDGIGHLLHPHSGLSQSPNLRPVPDSIASVTPSGHAVPHVFGPQQAAVDPIAAGLDLRHDIITRPENRVISQPDGTEIVPPPDEASEHVPGPTSANIVAAVDPAPVDVTPAPKVAADSASAAPKLESPAEEKAEPDAASPPESEASAPAEKPAS